MVLNNLSQNIRAVVFGASGGIGGEFIRQLNDLEQVSEIYGVSRRGNDFKSNKYTDLHADITDEDAVKDVVSQIGGEVNLIIIATGVLHATLEDGTELQPEKSMRQINALQLQAVMNANMIGPSLVMKHFLPMVPKDEPSICASFSARVGSISDNHIGGWYAYRASKAALNMMIKNYAIEMGRRYKKTCVIGLHPGTVDTNLSEPFQGNVPAQKLFSREQSVGYLMDVLSSMTAEHTGKCYDWQGEEILP